MEAYHVGQGFDNYSCKLLTLSGTGDTIPTYTEMIYHRCSIHSLIPIKKECRGIADRWLTNYTDRDVIAPQVVVGDDCIILLWTEKRDPGQATFRVVGESYTDSYYMVLS